MNFLSLKGTLLYYLEQLLFRRYEESENSFTKFSQNTHKPKSLTQKGKNLQVDGTVDIPLQKTHSTKAVLYTSPLPQLLPETGIANELLSAHQTIRRSAEKVPSKVIQIQHKAKLIESNSQNNYAENTGTLQFHLWTQFEIENERSGWLTFRLSDSGIAEWLEHLRTSEPSYRHAAQSPSEPGPVSNQHSQLAIWQTQYAHARCTSILKQWPSAPPRIRRPQAVYACDPTGMPWIDSSDRLQTQSPTAIQLIHTLIAVVDDMFWIPYRYPTKQYLLLLKRASQLYQAFESFYRQCLPGFSQFSWEEVSPDHQRVQTYIGLILVTQKVLKALLIEHLGKMPTDEL